MTASDVDAAIAAGADSVEEVKLWTRAGMGDCQGRTCLRILSAVLPSRLPRRRWPVRPVTLAALQRPLPEPADDLMGLLEVDLEAAARDAAKGGDDG